MKKFFSAVWLIAVSLIFTGIAGATQDTTVMPVSLTVTTQGSMSVTPMNFGSAPLGTNSIFTQAIITVNVPLGAPFNVSLDAGLHYLFNVRHLEDSGGNVIPYYITKDLEHATPWGDSDFENTFLSGTSFSGTGTGSDQAVTVYSALSLFGVTVPEATYTDTVTVMLYY